MYFLFEIQSNIIIFEKRILHRINFYILSHIKYIKYLINQIIFITFLQISGKMNN